jgi:hypothetical protein
MEESTITLKEWLQSSSVKFFLVCQQEKIEEMAVWHLINLAWQARDESEVETFRLFREKTETK